MPIPAAVAGSVGRLRYRQGHGQSQRQTSVLLHADHERLSDVICWPHVVMHCIHLAAECPCVCAGQADGDVWWGA